MKPLVYVAGPYRRPDPTRNTSRACRVGQALRDDLSVVPIIPHLNLIEHMVSPRADQYWLDATMDMLRHCHAVYRIEGYSEGADAEVIEAERLKIPVFYSQAKLAEWLNQWKAEHDLPDGGDDQEKPADDAGITGDARRVNR